MDTVPPSREAIEAQLARGEYGVARASLGWLLESKPTLSTAQYVVDRLHASGAPRTALRLAILRSYTIEPMVPLLRARAALHGLDLAVHVGEFNAYTQEMLDGSSGLFAFAPDVVVLAVHTESVLPDVWRRATGVSPEELARQVEGALGQLEACLAALRGRSQAHVLLHTVDRPIWPDAGLLDDRAAAGQVALIERYNEGLRRAAREHRGVYVLDFAALAARHGRGRFYDRGKWLTARMPFAHDALLPLADEHVRFLVPLAGRVSKVLVLDLDNTVWGGVVGEDGTFGVQIGAEYPGAAYLELQRAALDLTRRGILLAIASKNNPADALEVFEKRPEMLLRLEHFAATQIHWKDKAESLRAIASELNVGLDALAFVDDNPVERERIRLELPEVHVLDLPRDPMGYATEIRRSPVFERLTVSAEDRERGRMYLEQRQRTALEKSAASVEDYYRSLEMVATVVSVSPANLARIAQLTQKTNQFNLTTHRFNEQQIEAWAARPDARVAGFSVRDRFGDNGLVGVAIATVAGMRAEIDTFLLSCRVIGRTLETALLAHLVSWARERGATVVEGRYVPTKKNAPAREHYASHGFEEIEKTAEGSLFRLNLDQRDVCPPQWIRLEEA